MKSGWMVRAGRTGFLFDDFEKNNVVAVGWGALGDLSQYKSREEINTAYINHFGNEKPSKTSNAVAMIYKFISEIKQGDILISYSAERREYLVAEDLGKYRFEEGLVGEYPNLREYKLLGFIGRDGLYQKTKNSLGATLTLFSLNSEVVEDILSTLTNGEKPPAEEDPVEEVTQLKDDVAEQSLELIKDKVIRLDPDELEELTATVLRAMGFKAKVSPKGADRNVDVFASPDGLGLTSPRIKAEVKHRSGRMGAKEIRSFIGALREGDRGLFISTGGFTKDVRYEAERANVPVQLINIDDLAHLIVDNYENFDAEGRVLIPLVKLYWPAS